MDDPEEFWDPDEVTVSGGSSGGAGSEIAVAGPEDVQEDEFETSDFDAESINRFGSVASTIYRHAYENGRRYHKYRYGTYPIPNDETEQNREDIKHAAFLELTRGKYFFAPIGDYPQKIIDLGTGTGTWAIEVADIFPGAAVVGCDLSPIQPIWVPSNVTFVIDDVTDEWAHGDDWDLVHIRQMLPFMHNAVWLVGEITHHLRLGGWIEVQEYGGIIKCDDGTMPADSLIVHFYELITETMGKRNTRWTVANDLGEHLRQAGFVNIQCRKIKCPIGVWPKAKRLRLVGLYMKPVLAELFDAIAPRICEALGYSPKQMDDLLFRVHNELQMTTAHMYIDYFFWYAQKAPNT
ncbi:S-adenosyl-L-methionine-dependent methyltransferase [Xylariaceae sp. FL0662B]|nr:S-adenosyl-L-methionine-dependent methyltransferase [Xylariaceae sp. FL0662B]